MHQRPDTPSSHGARRQPGAWLWAGLALPRRAVRSLFALVAFASFFTATGHAQAQDIDRYSVEWRLEGDDTLLVEETFELAGALAAPLERTILYREAPGAVPRRRWLSDVEVTGDGVDWSSHDALDRTRVVITEGASPITLRYRMHRLVGSDGRFDVTNLALGGRRIDVIAVRFVPPEGVAPEDVSWTISVLGDEGDDRFFEQRKDARLEETIEVGATEVTVQYEIRVPAEGVERPDLRTQLTEMVRQAGMVPYLAAGFLLLSLLLRFAAIGVVIAFTRVWHVVATVPIVLFTWPDVFYFLRHGPLDEGLTSLGLGLSYVALVVGFVVLQDRGLREARRAAYYVELGFPVLLGLAFPVWNQLAVVPFLPFLGLPLAIYWLRDDVALAFGASSHRIVEHVVTEGRTTLDALATHLGVGRDRLVRVLEQQPDLPLVVDYHQGTVYSEQAAAQLTELAVCANCGGATEVRGMALLACPYCKYEYAQAPEHATRRPVPVIVEAFAGIGEVLAVVFGFWAITVTLAFAGLERGITAVVFVPLVLFGGLAYAALQLAESLREGRGRGALTVLLVATGVFVVPLFAFRLLRKRRVQIHFGEDVDDLRGDLEGRGELSVDELAARWETSFSEAAELARFLCATGTLDAVFDRPRVRIVLRRHYQTLEHQGACAECGGTLGVIGGTITCHYCRTPVAA